MILVPGATKTKCRLGKDLSSSSHPDTWQWLEQFCSPSLGQKILCCVSGCPIPECCSPSHSWWCGSAHAISAGW